MSVETDWAPVLSPKPFLAYSPDEFRDYVRSLKQERRSVRKAKGKKPKRPGYSARVSLRGTLIITTKRKEPKYLTQEELTAIGEKTGRPANEVFLYVKEKEFEVMSHEQADEVRSALSLIPW